MADQQNESIPDEGKAYHETQDIPVHPQDLLRFQHQQPATMLGPDGTPLNQLGPPDSPPPPQQGGGDDERVVNILGQILQVLQQQKQGGGEAGKDAAKPADASQGSGPGKTFTDRLAEGTEKKAENQQKRKEAAAFRRGNSSGGDFGEDEGELQSMGLTTPLEDKSQVAEVVKPSGGSSGAAEAAGKTQETANQAADKVGEVLGKVLELEGQTQQTLQSLIQRLGDVEGKLDQLVQQSQQNNQASQRTVARYSR